MEETVGTDVDSIHPDDDQELRGRFIKAIEGDQCGPFGHRFLYYRNTHWNQRIKVLIDHHWVVDRQDHHEPLYWVTLEPSGDRNPHRGPDEATDKRMGCPKPTHNGQEFFWDVKDAQWA